MEMKHLGYISTTPLADLRTWCIFCH